MGLLPKLRMTALRGGVLVGATAVGIGYYQRVPRKNGHPDMEGSRCTASRFYQTFVAPAVMLTDPETAHQLTLGAGRALQSLRLLAEPSWTGATPLDWLLRPTPSTEVSPGPSLRQEFFGGKLNFDSPFGIAAGFDKNAELVPLYRLGSIPGLGFSEVGSVSALPSDGNPKPRCFRVPSDEAVINRMGLNNEGSAAIAAKMKGYEPLGSATAPVAGAPPRCPVGVNITKTHSPNIMGEEAVQDFVTSFTRLAPHGDFVILNVSCPNTAEGKTFEDTETLRGLLSSVKDAKSQVGSKAPIFVKLSPPTDSQAGRDSLAALVEVAKGSGIVDGYVVSNTAGDRSLPLTREGKQEIEKIGKGGLSGKPLKARSTAAIREVYRLTGGQVPIIGVGGVDSPEAAYEKIKAGASLIEVYTGLVYKGPWLFSDLHLGVRRLLERDGYKSVSEAVGVDAKKV